MIDWNKELDKVEEAIKPIAEGEHTFRVLDATATVSSNGNRMIRTTVQVAEPDADAGKTAVTNLVFTFDNPRGMRMTLRRLAATGISQEVLKAENLTIEQIAVRLKGQTVLGKVSHREWNGEMQNDVEFVKSGGAGPNLPSAPVPTMPSMPTPPPPPPIPDTTEVASSPPQLPLDDGTSGDPF